MFLVVFLFLFLKAFGLFGPSEWAILWILLQLKLLSYMSLRKESIFYAVNGGKYDIITVFNKFDGCEF